MQGINLMVSLYRNLNYIKVRCAYLEIIKRAPSLSSTIIFWKLLLSVGFQHNSMLSVVNYLLSLPCSPASSLLSMQSSVVRSMTFSSLGTFPCLARELHGDNAPVPAQVYPFLPAS